MDPVVGHELRLGRYFGEGTSSDIYLGIKYRVSAKIAKGAFSEVFLATNLETGEEVAVKRENAGNEFPLLLHESQVHRILQGGTGIPNMKYFGMEGDDNVLVMSLLGPTLEDLFTSCSRRFTLKTVLMLADQMMDRIMFVHSRSFIHRDIKPTNFLMGLGRSQNQVYIIDFGLVKMYRRSKDSHIPFRENVQMAGTARFSSINAHCRIQPSRRDDLESLGYVLMYFLRGSLPWQGLQAETKELKFERIREVKVSTSIEELCQGFPSEFASYFHHCRSLKFDARPKYGYLKEMFRKLFIRQGFEFDYRFDWMNKEQQS